MPLPASRDRPCRRSPRGTGRPPRRARHSRNRASMLRARASRRDRARQPVLAAALPHESSRRPRSGGTPHRSRAGSRDLADRRSEGLRPVEEEGRRTQGAARLHVLRGLLGEVRRDLFVGRSTEAASCQALASGSSAALPGARGRACDAPGRRSRRRRPPERVRKPDQIPLELDDSCVQGRAQADVAVDAQGGLDDAGPRVGLGRSRQQVVAARGGSARTRPCTSSCSDSGTGKGCPASDLRASGSARSRARRGDFHPRPDGLRPAAGAQARSRGVRERGGAARRRRGDRPRRRRISRFEERGELRGQHAHVRTAGREENGHALFPQASRRIAECSRRGGVKPLNVVDRDEDGTLDGEAAERVEHCDADRVPIRIRALAVLLENEGAGSCGWAASAPRPPQRRASHQSPKSRARFRSPPDAPGARGGRAPRPLRCTPSRGSSCRSAGLAL